MLERKYPHRVYSGTAMSMNELLPFQKYTRKKKKIHLLYVNIHIWYSKYMRLKEKEFHYDGLNAFHGSLFFHTGTGKSITDLI